MAEINTLFGPEKLAANLGIWKDHLMQLCEGKEDRVDYFRSVVDTLPLRHVVHPDYLTTTLEQGRVDSLDARVEGRTQGGRGRTADSERQLGLGKYVFLSLPDFSGASGFSLLVPAGEILDKAGTVVTLKDYAALAQFAPGEREDVYEKMAFDGKGFKELLPLFLTAWFPSGSQRASSVEYPKILPEELRHPTQFIAEVKVRDAMPLGGNYKVEVDTANTKLVPQSQTDHVVGQEPQGMTEAIEFGSKWWGKGESVGMNTQVLQKEIDELESDFAGFGLEFKLGLLQSMFLRAAFEMWLERKVGGNFEIGTDQIRLKQDLISTLSWDHEIKPLGDSVAKLMNGLHSHSQVYDAMACDAVDLKGSEKNWLPQLEQVFRASQWTISKGATEDIGTNVRNVGEDFILRHIFFDNTHNMSYLVAEKDQGGKLVQRIFPLAWFNQDEMRVFEQKMLGILGSTWNLPEVLEKKAALRTLMGMGQGRLSEVAKFWKLFHDSRKPGMGIVGNVLGKVRQAVRQVSGGSAPQARNWLTRVREEEKVRALQPQRQMIRRR